jgi:hypothetical protein
MKTHRPSKLKALSIALAVSGALVFGGAGRAHAFVDPITVYAATMLGVIAIVGTYVAAKATVCTPVAAVKASDHAAGFGGAFKDCWDWSPISTQPASTGSAGSE